MLNARFIKDLAYLRTDIAFAEKKAEYRSCNDDCRIFIVHALSDVFHLDMEDMQWSTPERRNHQTDPCLILY
jgi:hypothetical protein